jgi:plasmid stabilization system protein ParE
LSYQIQVSRRAARQIRTAADWWSQNRPKAPEAFTEEIEKGFDLARSFPTAGEPVAHPRRTGVRRIHLGRIHYHLYYQVSTDAAETVEVLALWHTSRGSLPTL